MIQWLRLSHQLICYWKRKLPRTRRWRSPYQSIRGIIKYQKKLPFINYVFVFLHLSYLKLHFGFRIPPSFSFQLPSSPPPLPLSSYIWAVSYYMFILPTQYTEFRAFSLSFSLSQLEKLCNLKNHIVLSSSPVQKLHKLLCYNYIIWNITPRYKIRLFLW